MSGPCVVRNGSDRHRPGQKDRREGVSRVVEPRILANPGRLAHLPPLIAEPLTVDGAAVLVQHEPVGTRAVSLDVWLR